MSLALALSGGKTQQAGATQRGFHADIAACAALRSGQGFFPPPFPHRTVLFAGFSVMYG